MKDQVQKVSAVRGQMWKHRGLTGEPCESEGSVV